MKKFLKEKINKFRLSDRFCLEHEEDCFDVDNRFVNRIYNLVKDPFFGPLTIAITGEWGIGKSTVINRLGEKLNSDTNIILINFEPLLEGKLQIPELIELFYLKIYQKINNKHIRALLKKCIKSILLLSRFKFEGKIKWPNISPVINGEGSFQIDWEKNVNDFLELWEKTASNSFLNQTNELNKLLKENQFKIVVIIDEIDRLPALYIMNLLVFSRLLEVFDNLICIVGMDYRQVIRKIISEGELKLNSYEDAKLYLDKLFQAEFHLNIGIQEKVEFSLKKLKEIDLDEILKTEINVSYYSNCIYTDIIEYLFTPRQIKKWLISIKINYIYLKYVPDKTNFLEFLAVLVKHPIISNNLTNFTLPILLERYSICPRYLPKKFGIDTIEKIIPEKISKEIRFNIILASMGINSINFKEDNDLLKILKTVTLNPIEDLLTEDLLRNFFEETPVYLILRYISGFSDETELSIYLDFFGEKINTTINYLINRNKFYEHLASDIFRSMKRPIDKCLWPEGYPSFELLNNLWIMEIDCSGGQLNFFFDEENPMLGIPLFLMAKFPVRKVVLNADIFFSGLYIKKLMQIHGVAIEKEIYQIDKFITNSFLYFPEGFYRYPFLDAVDSLLEIIKLWLERFESDFFQNKFYEHPALYEIFLWFVRWGEFLNLDNTTKLSLLVVQFLNESNQEIKKNFMYILSVWCCHYEKKVIGFNCSPIEILFRKNTKLIQLINVYLDNNEPTHYSGYLKKLL
jgi:hypothetical protein